MENNCWSWEQKAVINELIQGLELTKKLRVEFSSSFSSSNDSSIPSSTSSNERRELLVQGILSSYEKALLVLKCVGSTNQMGQIQTQTQTQTLLPESPISANGSPQSDDYDNHNFRDGTKKRKMLPRWTEHVRVNNESGLEGPHEDGFSWRKYGQKDILGAKYPRSYYRCTFKNTQDCWATKQVQRSDEDPCVFEIIYRGKHTCSQGNHQAQQQIPSSPEKEELKEKQSQDVLLNYPTMENKERPSKPSTFCFPSTSLGPMEPEDNTNNLSLLSGIDNNGFLGSFSQSFMVSPTSYESNCLLVSSAQRMNFVGESQYGQRSECDITEILSAHTSATNSPILDLDFSLDSVRIDPNFSFDASGFFS